MTTVTRVSAERVIAEAAEGRLPGWAEVKPKRYAHMERVAGLLGDWACALALPAHEQQRWRATAWLHDSLRNAEPEKLRAVLNEPFRSLPPFFLHGPAAAALLGREGVNDQEMLEAIRYHTLGKPGLARLGRALITADYLEPGRTELPVWRSTLRARMPEALDAAFAEVVTMRVRVSVEKRKPLRPEFIAMYNELVGHAYPH